MKTARSSIIVVTLLSATALLSTSCANGVGEYGMRAPRSRYLSSASYPATTTSGSTTDGDYSCPASDNVVPDYDRNFNGTGFYKACANPTIMTQILVKGLPNVMPTICVYPVQYIDETHIYTKPDLNSSAPLSQCVPASEAGVPLDFAGVNYNTVFIVEKADKTQMDLCLIGKTWSTCPPYSFGKFR